MNGESISTKILSAYYIGVLEAEKDVGETAYSRGLKVAYEDALWVSIRADYERLYAC